MTDLSLRELERRFRESASVEDEVAWLRARLAAGKLDAHQVELAAFLGHPGCALIRGEPQVRLEPKEWAKRMVSLGSNAPAFALEACVRASRVYVAELTGTRWWQREPETWNEALELVDAWLAGTGRTPAEISQVAQELPVVQSCAAFSTQFVRDLLLAIGNGDPAQTQRVLRAVGEEGLRDCVAESLVPWSLGYS